MDDAVVVQIADRPRQGQEPLADQFARQAVGVTGQDGAERLAGDVFHDDPLVAVGVGPDVEQADEVGVLEVQALAHAAHLDLAVAAHQFQGHLLAPVTDGEIDLAETALADAAFEGVAFQRPLSGAVAESHGTTSNPRASRSSLYHSPFTATDLELRRQRLFFRRARFFSGEPEAQSKGEPTSNPVGVPCFRGPAPPRMPLPATRRAAKACPSGPTCFRGPHAADCLARPGRAAKAWHPPSRDGSPLLCVSGSPVFSIYTVPRCSPTGSMVKLRASPTTVALGPRTPRGALFCPLT